MVSVFEDPIRKFKDVSLQEVFARFWLLDPDGERTAQVFRETFDQLYDGQRTGRYRLDQLFKTEKTHFGTLIEINLQREFKLGDGTVLDFSVDGHEVDCKYSHTGQWMLPLESFDQLVLVAQADDRASTWSLGLIRVTQENRRTSENRDRKTGLNATGRANIAWIHRDRPMQPNVLLQLQQSETERIFAPKSGQARVNELFRIADNRRITRNIVATVAQQSDYMKRVRYNGGARTLLQPEGILILGGDYKVQQNLAHSFGAEVPEPGEFVSIRAVPSETGVLIDGRHWRLARTGEQPPVAAPTLPRSTAASSGLKEGKNGHA